MKGELDREIPEGILYEDRINKPKGESPLMTQRDLIDTILNGYRALGRKIQEKKIQYKTEVVPHLTPKEIEILDYIAQGQSNREIADLLNIPLQRIENHLHSIMVKLNITARSKPRAINRDKTIVKAHLTPKEIEVLSCITQGQSNKEIAATLNISLHTVKNHIQSIMLKVNVKKRTKLVPLNIEKVKLM